MTSPTLTRILKKLQEALQVELTTIPTYLYAWFSIVNGSDPAAKTVSSVVIEEMLHLAQAVNLIVAYGGKPNLYASTVVPVYPGYLPHHSKRPPLVVTLEKLSLASTANVFMRIELPEAQGANPEGDNYDTLGQFYQSITDDIRLFSKEPNQPNFAATVNSQLASSFYSPSVSDTGNLQVVTSNTVALSAIQTIVVQGEGMDPGRFDDPSKQELAHYFKFKQLILPNVTIPQTYNAPTNPTIATSPPAWQPTLVLFNSLYMYILNVILAAVQAGVNSKNYSNIQGALFTTMSALHQLGTYIMTQSLGPTFEFYQFQQSTGAPTMKTQINTLASAVPTNSLPSGFLATVQSIYDIQSS